ncbi:MAG: hypothetical protein HC822_19175 [Oscillochloris sp.]|nr:hypothetical protein [Oscillochloris sp.]
MAAAFSDCCGSFNLAAEDTICLSQAIRLAGRQPNSVLEPLVGLAISFNRRNPLADWPYPVDFLRHSCVVATARAQRELGWMPAHRSAEMITALRNRTSRPDFDAAEAALQTFLGRKGKELSHER